MATKATVIGYAYAYRNVTENGGARKASMSLDVVRENIAAARLANPAIQFEFVVHEVVESFKVVWRQGQGRAGNSFPTKEKVKLFNENYGHKSATQKKMEKELNS